MSTRGPFYCACSNHAWGTLTRGYVVLVSPEDARFLEANWYAFINPAGNVYAAKKMSTGHQYLHRSILGTVGTRIEVDHANRNGLDDRRPNLRKASKAENAINRRKKPGCSSSFKGVTFVNRRRPLRKPWVARFQRKILGYFATEQEAGAEYLKAARAMFGGFAKLVEPHCRLAYKPRRAA